MEQWLSIFFKVALPVFKTLVYAGTNHLLSNVREELEDQQKHQVKQVIKTLNVRNHLSGETETIAAVEQIAELGYKTAIELHDLVKDVTTTPNQTNIDFHQQRFQQEKILQQKLVADKRKAIFQLASYQRETTLLLPEVQKSFEHWPLRLFPCQLLESHPGNQPIPLRVLLAPPQISLAQIESPSEIGKLETEKRLSQGIRKFLSQHYSLHNETRRTEFLGGAWKPENFYGEASIKALFWMLKSEPTLILESEIDGKILTFRLAYWGLGQEQYFYGTIFQIPYEEFLLESARKRALKWKETRQKLIKLGKSPEVIERLGGENISNLAILEEAEELEQAGIDITELPLALKTTYHDWENLLNFLGLCHCLVGGWIADIHYLIQNDLPPILPELLPQLIQDQLDNQSSPQLLKTTVSIYGEVLQNLAKERPYWIPELSLKLAKSLSQLPDQSLALEQVNYSLKIWLQQRQLSPVQGLQNLEIVKPTLTNQDREYLKTLQECLATLGDHQRVIQVQGLLSYLDTPKDQNIPEKQLNFSLFQTLNTTSGSVNSLTLTPDGRQLVILGDRSVIEVWTLTPSTPILTQSLTHHCGEVLAFSLSPDQQILATSDHTNTRNYIKLWHLPTETPEKTLFGHKKEIYSLMISPDGQTLISASHKIKLWNLKTGEPFQTLFGHREWITCLGITPDGHTLISGSQDKTLRVWHLTNGELYCTLTGHQGEIKTVAISPDGRFAVSGSTDNTLIVWDIKAGKLVQTLNEHTGAVNAVTFSRDGQYFVSGSDDTTIKVWNCQTLDCVQTLLGNTSPITAIALSNDGQTLINGTKDNTLQFWR
ncbi:WD-40 repeat protein [Gloeothece citriformis PCC 7424]|uniref:WD-40 repeat protein n=1 Tax=Gloeothece citriformis (strain PCC 7424) TaxID=65393 RepID=B7KE61_GLOC7|nr:WD40 repeat domain-containing protein [Gloeothece citriformis]ACK71759.1 WD-40 repeat protein [Gloeothece citriformis PCC 7424]